MIIKSVRETMFVGRKVAHWTIIEMTNERSKAGSIIWKCKNNVTGKIEYKSGAYLVQYLKRKSQKTFPGRYRHFVRIPLEEFQEFATNLNFLCPKLFRYIKDAKITSLKDIGMLFETTKDCAQYGTTKGRMLRVQRERQQDLLNAIKKDQKSDSKREQDLLNALRESHKKNSKEKKLKK